MSNGISAQKIEEVKRYLERNYVSKRQIFEGGFPQISKSNQPIRHILSSLEDGFAVSLLKQIDEKGLTDVECYKRAGVSKQTWYKIMNEDGYQPSKNTVLCFAFALQLSLSETQRLLQTAGYALSKSKKKDVIIEYFLSRGEYDLFVVNEALFAFGQTLLR